MENSFLLAEIAKLYYIDKIKQKEIAERFQTTPMQISRLLKMAEDEGIVSFYVQLPARINASLGKWIKDKYKLSECIVLDIGREENKKEIIGKFAADYVMNLVGRDSVIGLSWGRTLCEFAKNLPYSSYPDCKVVQLAGGFIADSNHAITPSSIIKMVSEKLGCIPVFLHAPFSVGSLEVKKQLLEDPSYKYLIELASRANINIIGTGDLHIDSTIMEVGILNTKDRLELLDKGAVGEIAGFPVDKDGNEISWNKSNLYMGVPLHVIKKSPNVICLSGEAEKAGILAAGMKTKCFNILITSQEVADTLNK